MDVRQLSQDYLIVIFLLALHRGISSDFDDDRYEDEDTPSFGRCPWIRNKLKNGRVKIRSRGRIAKFICDPGYELAGKRFATCVRGQWNNPIPVCVARGCSRKPPISNGRITEMYRGAVLVYDCNPGYSLDGQVSIYCDGRRWSTEPPACVAATAYPELSCDFEDPDLCGWSHDPNHDFDWKRNQFATPSGHDGTGPSYDHTFGIGKGGFYLYLEASSPRKTNDTTRLFSPVYPPDYNDGCFTFWYHMYGATTGGLRVYLKRESQVFGEIAPTWEKFGDQGQQWLRGYTAIPTLHENFQIVIEGLRGTSYVGDSAIDDVQLSKGTCESIDNSTDTVAHTAADSCRGRCREADEEASCGCNEDCEATDTCCSDYTALCTTLNDTSAESSDEPLPEDELGKTSSPVTVTIAKLTTLKTTETLHDQSTQKFKVQSTIQMSPTISEFSTTATAIASTETSSLASSSTATFSTTQAKETASYTTLSSTAFTKPISVETKISQLVTKPISEKPLSVSTPSSTTEKAYVTTPTTTSIPTTVSALVTNTETTITSTTQAVTTASKISTVVSPIKPTPNYISVTSLSSASVESTSQIVTLPASNNATISNGSLMSSSSVSSSITSTSSTRKTYNLRPRTEKTTPIPSEVTFNSTASTIGPITNTATFESTTILNASTSVTNISIVTPTIAHQYNNDDVHDKLNETTRTVLSSSSSTMMSTTMRRSQHVSTPQSTTVTTNRPSTILLTANTWFTRGTTTRVPSPRIVSESTQTTLLATMTLQENHVSKEASTANNESLPIVTIISITIVIIICVAAGLTYYIKKQKAKRRSRLSEDSEMRFLSNSEEMEYSDASFLDKILIK